MISRHCEKRFFSARKGKRNLIFVDPNFSRHAVLQFRIGSGVKADLHIELIGLALVGDAEDDVALSGGRADLVDDAVELARAEGVDGEVCLLSDVDVRQSFTLVYMGNNAEVIRIDYFDDAYARSYGGAESRISRYDFTGCLGLQKLIADLSYHGIGSYFIADVHKYVIECPGDRWCKVGDRRRDQRAIGVDAFRGYLPVDDATGGT